MFAIKSVPVLLFMFILVSDCKRRIIEGNEVAVDRKYVVYLVKAPISKRGYDNWLCGGAIVSSEFVITSAACVNDVEFLYVVAGYRKYVSDAEIESDLCTATMKKKVTYTCSPTGYELKYGELDYWSYVDIALVRVESPFDFDDFDYEKKCSYKPTTIAINYEEKYQQPGTDALVLGWGHINNWRLPGDLSNYNQENLRYAPILLLNKTICIERYKDYMNMSEVIKTYMICSLGKGNIDDAGNTIQINTPLQNGCTNVQEKVLGFEGVSCEAQSSVESYDDDYGNTRRHGKTKGKRKSKTRSRTKSKTRSKTKSKSRSKSRSKNKTKTFSSSDFNLTRARRSGICQNDHGGPIVTWAGAKEILIGVASVFKVSDEFECMGPYLYTSTLCTGLFLDCVLNSELPNRRSESRYLCNRPASERGYDTIERKISWKDHPAGPAENENIGRSGPEPKMAPGLKYLTNNNYQVPKPRHAQDARNQEAMKAPSNTMFQANPTVASPEHKERFKIKKRNPDIQSPVQETISVNIRQQETMLATNNQYFANKNPGINYARKEMERYTNKRKSGEESSPEKGIKINHDNETNPATIRHSTIGQYPVHRYPVNQKLPALSTEPPKNHQLQAMKPQQPLRK